MAAPVLTHIHFALILPWLVIRRTVKYHAHGPPHPAWGLFLDLVCSSARLYFSLAQRHMREVILEDDIQAPPTPGDDTPQFNEDAWRPKPYAHKFAGVGTRVEPVRLRAVADEWRRGVALVGAPFVRAVDVPGFWVVRDSEGSDVPAESPARDGEKVIMYLPGGGIHPMTSPVSYGLALATNLRVLTVTYRSAKSSSSAFPAQLLDALAGYVHLISLGFRPSDVILVGESAGAFAILALMRYLGELRADASSSVRPGMVGAVALVSPACNLSRFDHPEIETDYRLPYYRKHTVPALARHFDLEHLHESLYFSPALARPEQHAFAHLLPSSSPSSPSEGEKVAGGAEESDDSESKPVDVWVQYSDCELFADDMRRLVEAMRADGVHVRHDEVWGGLHADAIIKRSVKLAGAGVRREIRRRVWPWGTKTAVQLEKEIEEGDGSWARLVKVVKEMARTQHEEPSSDRTL
ncbi:Alpha/Beta hydrolase protein [Fomitopsis serialis]|uniref:Alpha/Beta hydrolase protein n=1 Tax=Fomitopsis serialis TaxID=139415 RepID=UPI0020071F03|nr:Alpha/Beta hydrolase protein [Neoantrodia serialis]KAH9920958.1 Alpha/Beta hydrolase protein [Neoantrodia serialis]